MGWTSSLEQSRPLWLALLASVMGQELRGKRSNLPLEPHPLHRMPTKGLSRDIEFPLPF